MKIFFIAPIKIHANASAGAETINIYINELSKLGNKVSVISDDDGRYNNLNIEYYNIPQYKSNRIANILFKIYKTIGWFFYPNNKYLYKILPSKRNKIIKILKNFKKIGYNPDVIFLETTTAILMVDLVKNIFPSAIIVASLHDFAFQGSYRKAKLEKNKIKAIFRKRFLKFAEIKEVVALSKCDIIAPHNAGNKEILGKYSQLENSIFFPLVPFYSDDYCHNENIKNNDILFYRINE